VTQSTVNSLFSKASTIPVQSENDRQNDNRPIEIWASGLFLATHYAQTFYVSILKKTYVDFVV